MAEAMALFQAQFQVLSQKIKGKEYGVRFLGAPYTDEAASILLYTDSRNPELLGGPSILGAIEKFKISDADFRAAYNEFYARK